MIADSGSAKLMANAEYLPFLGDSAVRNRSYNIFITFPVIPEK